MLSPPTLVPGLYSPGTAALLRANEQGYLLKQSVIGPGQSSAAAFLERIKGTYYPWGISFEISFDSNPGPFQIDIQTSDSDVEASYVTISSLTTGLNASNVGRVELNNFWAKYVRVNIVRLTNPVEVTVLVTR